MEAAHHGLRCTAVEELEREHETLEAQWRRLRGQLLVENFVRRIVEYSAVTLCARAQLRSVPD
jgi:hypothetical protein